MDAIKSPLGGIKHEDKGMNLFCFTGHLGRDSEIRYAPSGTAICSFPVAVKSGYGQNEKTVWIQCALFGKRAEGELPQYLLKGTQVCIAGEVSLNEWTAPDGTNKAAIRVMVDKLDLVGGKPSGQSSGGTHTPSPNYQQPAQQPATQDSSAQTGFEQFDNTDIPF